MATAKSKMEGSKVVSQTEWLAARKNLLSKEKEFTRLRDELSRQRRELPWEKIEKEYVFDGQNSKETLADLFGGKSQLMVYHFMFSPGWEEGCPSCSFLSDHIDGSLMHLAARDVTLVVVSRAPLAQIEAFRKRMGWRFKWVSSYGNDFNRDHHVSFTKEEMANGQMYYNYVMQHFPREEGPGMSAFYKDGNGGIFHTYSSYGRGLDMLVGTYNWLDLAPKGRDEDDLAFTMAWVRHHDKYGDVRFVDQLRTYSPPKSDVLAPKSSDSCCSGDNH
ncbi:MAG TPA: thioredoxin family protein [Candidatus Dormibacteraeota bacterium]|nr:thioredoxin family protein [Candidatus Dormibacteraeota bacterium]